jgi:hypothetical protein
MPPILFGVATPYSQKISPKIPPKVINPRPIFPISFAACHFARRQSIALAASIGESLDVLARLGCYRRGKHLWQDQANLRRQILSAKKKTRLPFNAPLNLGPQLSFNRGMQIT